MEAVILASIPSTLVSRPTVSLRRPAEAGSDTPLAEYLAEANQVYLYRDDPDGCHCLLIHQFLHAIYHQTRDRSGVAGGTEEVEAWVASKIGWRASSNACRLSPHPHAPALRLERSAALEGAAGSGSAR
jgi:hypothetical protein